MKYLIDTNILLEILPINYRARVHKKKQQLMTPSSLRFPLLAGGTERARGSPRKAGATEPVRGPPRKAGGTYGGGKL